MSFKVILGILFGLLVTTIVAWGIISYQNSKLSVEAAELVRRTHEVLERTDEISSLFKDIQLESNAFFISHDSSLLRPYLDSRDLIIPRIDQLRALSGDHQIQLARIDSLRSNVQQLINFTNEAITHDKHNFTREQLDERVRIGFNFRKKIRGIIEGIKSEEQTLLIKRERAHRISVKAFDRTFLFLIGGIAVLLGTTFFSIRYNFNKRVRAQEEQKKSSELFTKLFYESPIGLVITKLDTGEIIDCNRAYAELIKFSKTELIGKTMANLGISRTPQLSEQIADGVQRLGSTKDVEVQLVTKGNNRVWVSLSMQSILIGNEVCLLSAVLDMTAHKEAEKKMKKALSSEIELNKLKSNFVTLASHEFRTPLTTILSSASLLENYSFGDNKEKVNKHVSRIKGSVSLLTSILDEFLSLTKIEEGRVAAKKDRINVKETLERVCSSFNSFVRSGQKITYRHSGDEWIFSDPVLIGSIVTNLVSNAIKYSFENAEISVSCIVDSTIRLAVKDNGIGISKEDQHHLFERFFRASNTGNIQGTGLGLHILEHYVDMLEGSIQVQSEPGKGSEFIVTFDNKQSDLAVRTT